MVVDYNKLGVFVIYILTGCCFAQDNKELYLIGTGASFPGEVYEAWAPAFENERDEFLPNFENVYTAVGSGEGLSIAALDPPWPGDVAYVASDSVLEEQEYAENPGLQMMPVLGGAVVLAYNLPGVASLNLSVDAVVGIYNGTIQWWNDTALQAANPAAELPDRLIQVVARADDSGTTEIFTSVLSMLSPEWNETYGTFSQGTDDDEINIINWAPGAIDLLSRTSRGMSGVVLSYRNSIGYMSSADAGVASLPFASLVVEDGRRVVRMEVYDIEDAMERSLPYLSPRLTANLAHFVTPGEEYPFIGYSYFVVNMNMSDCDVAIELVRYVEWLGSDPSPREEAAEKLMAPLVPQLAEVVKQQVLREMTCGSGSQNVYSLVEAQRRRELVSTQKWRVPVFVTAPLLLAVIIALLGYVAVQRLRLRRALLSDEWRIAADAIAVTWDRDHGLAAGGATSAVSLTLSTISNVSMATSPHVYAIGTMGKDHKAVCLRQILVRDLNTSHVDVKRQLLWMRDKLLHVNVLRFYGVTALGSERRYFVSEHASKGTLSDVVQNDKYKLDDNIKFALGMDIATGMAFLHANGVLHGSLRSECCFIDHRWNVKVAEFEMHTLETVNRPRSANTQQVAPAEGDSNDTAVEEYEDPNIQARQLFWRDPALLLLETQTPAAVRRHHDVYSFSIILVEIFTREDPFTELSLKLEPHQVLAAIVHDGARPDLTYLSTPAVTDIIVSCWAKDASKRPTFNQLKKSMKKAKPSKKSVMDSMMEALEGYVDQLEERVAERTVELNAANTSLETLLHQMLPASVATALSRGDTVTPEAYTAATIFFSDIVGFTSLSAASTPMDIVNLLNDLYTTFDSVLDHHDVYKVETIGDAYMVISGVPQRNGDDHAAQIATMALDLLTAAGRLKVRHMPERKLQLRAGIHTGSVVAGVVGLKMPRYCLFGDTVNTASRMESTSEAMKIQVSATTHALLLNTGDGGFVLEPRGDVQVKGKGTMKTYFLISKRGYTPLDPTRNYNVQFLRP